MLLEHNAMIETAGKDGITAMHCAVQSGNTNIMQELIKCIKIRRQKHTRTSETYVDRNGRQPIHWAAVEGVVDIVRLLKDDIGLTDRFGWTALHLAAIYGHKRLLKYIIEDCAANINASDNDSRTPLHLAVENKALAAVHILLDAEAKVNTIAKDGSTPLHIAIEQKEILIMLLKNSASPDAVDIEGRTPLYLAVADGITEAAVLLIDRGADVTIAAKDGRTPLHIAFSRGQDGLGIAKRLLQAGADINAKAKDGATALHVAAQCDLSKAINMLVEAERRFDINATDEYGQTPLLIAIYESNWDAAKSLLDLGASVEADEREGYKPLLGAVIGGNEEIVQQLLEANANIDTADEDGYSPLHLAVLDGKRDIIRILLNADANIDAVDELMNETPLHIAVRKGHREIVEVLLKHGATAISLNSRGFSPLQHALYCGDLPMVRTLVEHDKTSTIKAALQKNNEGNTPLHTLADCEKDEEIICEMLDELLTASSDIDFNADNSEGNTPLDSALSKASKHRRFINKMVENGAKPGSEETRKLFEDWKSMKTK